jgi:uncharacterized protein DUF1707
MTHRGWEAGPGLPEGCSCQSSQFRHRSGISGASLALPLKASSQPPRAEVPYTIPFRFHGRFATNRATAITNSHCRNGVIIQVGSQQEVFMDRLTGRMDGVDDQPSGNQMRAADSDRERVAEQLRSAHAEGRLDLTEYDQRVQQAWAARTYGELEVLTADLPQTRSRAPAVHQDRRSSGPQQHHGRGGHAAVAAWASASAINLMIWAIVSLTTLSWVYPWWIWVAGPWGAMLLAGRLSRRGDRGGSPG